MRFKHSPSDSSSHGNGSRFDNEWNAQGTTTRVVKKRLNKKLVVVGDGACGKTSMLTVFTQNFFPTDYEPTVFENYVETVNVDGQVVDLSLWDTAGQEEFDRLRSLSYADTHVVMVCFSVERPESLENVEAKWIPEVNYYCAGVKVILVALKCDLRDDPEAGQRLRERGMRMVGYEEGLQVAQRVGATRYLECSAKMGRGVREAILEAARVAVAKGRPASGIAPPREGRRRSRCVVL
ncbi:Rho GTPase [Naganishia albida]|nr:Rho GTPase [Naganishia albida]